MFVGFLEEPFSQEPMLWGVEAPGGSSRLNFSMKFCLQLCLFSQAPKPQLRALATWGLGKARYQPAAGAVQALTGDEEPGPAL